MSTHLENLADAIIPFRRYPDDRKSLDYDEGDDNG